MILELKFFGIDFCFRILLPNRNYGSVVEEIKGFLGLFCEKRGLKIRSLVLEPINNRKNWKD